MLKFGINKVARISKQSPEFSDRPLIQIEHFLRNEMIEKP